MRKNDNKFADFLLEIGTEEIPSSYLSPAGDQMRQDFETFLSENSLAAARVTTLYTPRRLTLVAKKVPFRQKDVTVQILGPPARLCFDKEGRPTETLTGFAKSHRVKVDAVRTTKTKKGEYVCVEKLKRGRTTPVVLKEYLPTFIKNISFPKSMRWLKNDFRFARPIRWILVLYGEKTITLSVASVKSARFTYGHRILHPGRIRVRNPEDYVWKLKQACVIVDPSERLSRIEFCIDEKAAQVGGKAVMDDELLSEVNNLLEYPVCTLGRFDSTYLRLPMEVVLTAMKVHQRYFGVVDKKGGLIPYFIAVVSGDKKHLKEILDGNERVLQARLADALFYWDADRKVPPGDRIDSLKNVVWLEGMGNLYDKTERLAGLAALVASGLEFREISVVERAAWLSKTDLLTSMIKDGKEFTTLEGKMGMEYALQSGENKDVAIAIHEHHLPKYPGDSLPETPQGTILAIADRIDTVVGGFIAGHKPTGSQDPQGLRRRAMAVISIIAEKHLSLNLATLIDKSINLFERQNFVRTGSPRDEILRFFRNRVENWLQEEGFRYDLVEAVLSAKCADPFNAKMRVAALDELRGSADFIKLVIAQKRVANILKDQPEPPPLTDSLFSEEAERQLFLAIKKTEPEYRKFSREGNYRGALQQLLSLRAPIDRLFDEVLIMTKNKNLRMNRFALLKYTRTLFSEIAVLSKIVIE